MPPAFSPRGTARWPDPHTGDRIRVEHWVVAERMVKSPRATCWAAANGLTWCRSSGVALRHVDQYAGHADKWDAVQVSGSLESPDCSVAYKRGDRTLAVATIGRDLESLRVEAQMESPTKGRPR